MEQGKASAFADFGSAARAALADLKDGTGLGSWFVCRRDGEDCVVLEAADDLLDIVRRTVYRWDDTYCARVLEGADPVSVDVREVPAVVHAREVLGVEVGTCVAVPLVGPDRAVLGFLSGAGPGAHLDELRRRLPQLRLQAGLLGGWLSQELRIAQEVLRAERAETASTTDSLTGVGNRRAWDAALLAEDSHAQLYADSSAVIVIDLDAMKAINDQGGHEAGDRALVRTAAVLRAGLREDDLIARLGGDEFGVLLPATDLRAARAMADRLFHSLRVGGVACSLGVSARRSGSDLRQAWREADVDMYRNKARRDAAPVSAAIREKAAARTGPATEAAPADTPPELTTVDALLRLVRDQLGMQVAVLHKHLDAKQRVRNLQSKVDLPVHRGYTDLRADGYGQLLLDGLVPAVIGDTSTVAVLRDHPATRELRIGCHVGIALYRADGSSYGTLSTFSQRQIPGLRPADADVLLAIGPILMKLVEQEEDAEDGRHAFISRLDSLYASGGPAMVYQPLFDLPRLVPVGAEALSRFPLGTPDPADWFRKAHSVGLGVELELAALSNAFASLDEVTGFLSVNVSSETVCSPKFGRMLAALPMHRIVVELTVHAPIEDYDTLNEALGPLRRNGLRVAIDDAGAGYACMRHILSIVPDFIKLDLSLVRGIDSDLPRQALAAALAAFAFTTDALVVAEGIETAAELATLERLGIHYGQGYHLGRPSSPTSIAESRRVLPA